jgi:ATP-dependent protease ClpP protease subunit
MASLLLAAGEPGERRCLPNARIMVHQPIGGAQVRVPQHACACMLCQHCCPVRTLACSAARLSARPQGQASDILIQAREIERLRDLLISLYVKHCSQDTDTVGASWCVRTRTRPPAHAPRACFGPLTRLQHVLRTLPRDARACACHTSPTTAKTLDRDFYMTPDDARAWRLVDHVIEHRPLETAVTS